MLKPLKPYLIYKEMPNSGLFKIFFKLKFTF